MRRFILLLALLGVADAAYGKDVYLYDLLKDPVHAQSWKTMLSSAKQAPA